MAVHKNNEIISNFYLIRENGQPTYIGYTNRSIKQRFTEHLHDKDFTGDATVEELDSLSFPFTWDINLINQYAKEVSHRESELIAEYGTGDSVWQKGINGNIGGQTWSDVKHFVMTNRKNPKFAGMDDSEIPAYIDRDRLIKRYMGSFVSNMEEEVNIYMKNFVTTMNNSPVDAYLHEFVNNMQLPEVQYMKDFIARIEDPTYTYMRSFVNHMDLPEVQYMKDFVRDMESTEIVYMKNFVKHMNANPAKGW